MGLTQNGNTAAIINWVNTSDWTTVTENGKTYKYYNYKLQPNETTSTLLDSVTFNSAITNDSNCVTEETSTGKTITCTSTGDGYDGATYKLVFTVETVQYDKYADAWNTNASIANTSKPAPVVAQTGVQKLISKVNSSDKTYETGDRGEMFAFSHPQTEQMKATTDYRYIGNVPNNYVKFNCDNDGINCEIWRIIGVFEVDDGTGTYEQRIKLVRGSAFSTEMAWDTRVCETCSGEAFGKNEWNGADLEVFLNGDYLNRENTASTYGLKSLAQSQIADAKYYLGGITYDSTIHYGSTDDIYVWERGNTVYEGHSTSWQGKVALLYPSEYGYTFAMEVNESCFSDLYRCSDGWNSSISSWILLSNNFSVQWTLSPNILYSDYVLPIFGFGNFGTDTRRIYGQASSKFNIRPVVYLKSSIQIISGDGSEQNPYELSL